VNELELVTDPNDWKEYIYATVFQKNVILKIDRETGLLVKKYEMQLL
jgi:glutamine cyclotransferase